MDVIRLLGSAASWTIAATVAAGCAGYPTNVASGGPCQRSVQCGPGLVCSQGRCTNDLSMFGNGHPTSLDSGLLNDAGDDASVMVDAAPLDDANLPDTGAPNDAFTPPNDAFTPPNDAFTPPNDAFTPPNDAFVGDDAFVADDAFVGDDAGTDAGP